jgi:anaphase-promoting complex subunit 8
MDGLDAFLYYLYGKCLSHQKSRESAIHYLIHSIQSYPYNWSAWQELDKCIVDEEQLHAIMNQFPPSYQFMKLCFMLSLSGDFYDTKLSDTLNWINELNVYFPGSKFGMNRKAVAYYNARGIHGRQ